MIWGRWGRSGLLNIEGEELPRNRSLLKVKRQRDDMVGSMLQVVGSRGMWRMKGRLENQRESGSPVRNLLQHPRQETSEQMFRRRGLRFLKGFDG